MQLFTFVRSLVSSTCYLLSSMTNFLFFINLFVLVLGYQLVKSPEEILYKKKCCSIKRSTNGIINFFPGG